MSNVTTIAVIIMAIVMGLFFYGVYKDYTPHAVKTVPYVNHDDIITR